MVVKPLRWRDYSDGGFVGGKRNGGSLFDQLRVGLTLLLLVKVGWALGVLGQKTKKLVWVGFMGFNNLSPVGL